MRSARALCIVPVLFAVAILTVMFRRVDDRDVASGVPYSPPIEGVESDPDVRIVQPSPARSVDAAPQRRTHAPRRNVTTVVDLSPLRCRLRWLRSGDRWIGKDQARNSRSTKSCPLFQTLDCVGRPWGRALVIYMLHTRPNAHDMQPEMWNFDYFSRFGVFGANESTQLFSSVDYIFTRMRSPRPVDRVTVCSERENIRLVWVPDGPCDLCAHHRVIEYLGGVEAVIQQYRYVVYMNAGTRGPFQHRDAPAWIDVMAVGEETEWSEKTTPTATGPTVSTDHMFRPPIGVHVQGFMVGVTATLLRVVDPTLNRCTADKGNCIIGGETAMGTAVINAGGWLRSMQRNITMHNNNDVQTFRGMQTANAPMIGDPSITTMDVCMAMFVKHGGTFLRMVGEDTASQAAHLTVLQPPNRALQGTATLKSLLQDTSCDFMKL